jgi:acetaldehyde dehydrogenase
MNQVGKLNVEDFSSTVPLRALILGSGNIGTDLALRINGDSRYEVVGLVGRRRDSAGLIRADSQNIPVFWQGAERAIDTAKNFDVLFDATSALDHPGHWQMLEGTNKLMIDLTPSQIGQPMVPILMNVHQNFNLFRPLDSPMNYSMVTCGGQSAAALIFSLEQASDSILDLEVSSSIAAKSAGLATRRNVDNYISATENLAKLISKCENTKAILVLNPAEPPVMMRTTVTLRAKKMDLELATELASKFEKAMQSFVPGYRIIIPIHALGEETYSASVLVEGAGFYLPTFSGNLDVINAAAVETAIRYFGLQQEEVMP